MKKTLFTLLAFGIFTSCNKEREQTVKSIRDYDKIEEMNWLIGNWTHATLEEQSH